MPRKREILSAKSAERARRLHSAESVQNDGGSFFRKLKSRALAQPETLRRQYFMS